MTRIRVSWLLPRYFSSHLAHSFTIFAVPRGGIKNSQPRRGEPHSHGRPALPRPSKPHAFGALSCREGFFGRKARGGLGFQAATCCITAHCSTLVRLRPRSWSSSAQRADSACAHGSPASGRAQGHHLFPFHLLEPGLLPDVAATTTHLVLENYKQLTLEQRGAWGSRTLCAVENR